MTGTVVAASAVPMMATALQQPFEETHGAILSWCSDANQ
ncbi:hypothetical protein CLJ1_2874 [Pseudomonas paraeruginosa]|nr:hypothetical protein CLJ1_2874 [Pseudomonas aeruginosa]